MKATDDVGTGLRKTLRSIWDTHRSDEELRKYLGKGLVDSIKEAVEGISLVVGERATSEAWTAGQRALCRCSAVRVGGAGRGAGAAQAAQVAEASML